MRDPEKQRAANTRYRVNIWRQYRTKKAAIQQGMTRTCGTGWTWTVYEAETTDFGDYQLTSVASGFGTRE